MLNFVIKIISIQFPLDIGLFLFVLTDSTVEFGRPNSKIRQNIKEKPKIAEICIFSKKTWKYVKKNYILKCKFW